MLDGLRTAGVSVLAASSEAVDIQGVVSPTDFLSRTRQRGAAVARSADSAVSTRLARSVSVIQTAHTLLDLSRLPSRRVMLRRLIREFRPDVVHALRLPSEGLSALSIVKNGPPVVVSTWGSDFEPMASRDILLRRWLKLVLWRAQGIHVDSPGDYERAINYGFSTTAPHLYAAGNFGVDTERFHVGDEIEPGLIVYPRRANPGFNYRGFVRAIMELGPDHDYRVVGVGLDEVRAELIAEFGDGVLDRIELTKRLNPEQFASLLRRADIVVSPAYWDGTPNSVIEAYVCGCRIIVGRLPQFEDLVQKGIDLNLVDITDWREMHQAIAKLLHRPRLGTTERALPIEFDRSVNHSRFLNFYSIVRGR